MQMCRAIAPLQQCSKIRIPTDASPPYQKVMTDTDTDGVLYPNRSRWLNRLNQGNPDAIERKVSIYQSLGHQ